MGELEELRRLLLQPEQDELRSLREHIEDRGQRAHEVAGVLPEAIKLARNRQDELTRAIEPVVENSIRVSIEKRPEVLVEAISPIIGPMIRHSVAESMRSLLERLNKTLEHTFSWQGFKWRLEALRTGRSFAEVVLLRSLVFRVEEVFLIHRKTGLSLLHVAADPDHAKDSDMVAGMLTAIQDFTRDSFKSVKADEALEDFRVGEQLIWLIHGPLASLAVVFRGSPPRSLRATLEETLDSIHLQCGAEMAAFQGDASVFEVVRPDLEACLREQYRPQEASSKRLTSAWLVVAGATALLIFGVVMAVSRERRWEDFLGRLNAEPGLAVTTAHQGWFFPSQVSGLRDAMAADPKPLARAARLDPEKIRFAWKPYHALDDVIVRRRFEERFRVPPGAQLSLQGGEARLTGTAPYDWLQEVRRDALYVPGVTHFTEEGIRVTYDPAATLARFEAAFPPPKKVKATIENQTLHLSGETPYEWIAPVRTGALRLPGIAAISEKGLTTAFDYKRVQERVTERFGLPDTVTSRVENGTLYLRGEASHAWLTRVRASYREVPGVTKLDESQLTDLDQRAFQQSKSVIESAFIYFLSNQDKFATEAFAPLSRLPEEIRTLLGSGRQLGFDSRIEVRGSADGTGATEKNRDLSVRRAVAVRDFLVSCGLESDRLQPLGLGQVGEAGAGERPAAQESDRRVAFRVITEPISGRP